MQYTMYYEEQRQISHEQYGQLKQNLMRQDSVQKLESYTVRKLRFYGCEGNDAVAQYYLCAQSGEEERIYLEKKYIQGSLWHKARAEMDREECERILRGDIQWMERHREVLFQDFYLQATLNHLSPGNVIEYQREFAKCKGGCVTFNKSVSCVMGGKGRLLEKGPVMYHCLDEDKILMTYKKKATLPNTVRAMMQTRESVQEEAAFAF